MLAAGREQASSQELLANHSCAPSPHQTHFFLTHSVIWNDLPWCGLNTYLSFHLGDEGIIVHQMFLSTIGNSLIRTPAVNYVAFCFSSLAELDISREKKNYFVAYLLNCCQKAWYILWLAFSPSTYTSSSACFQGQLGQTLKCNGSAFLLHRHLLFFNACSMRLNS